jgi:glycosyltransferase involved in cell wall biosynthesis
MGIANINTTPLISVIITAYNRGVFLRDTLDSIQNQTYSNIEILVIDDGSNKEEAVKNKLLCEEFDKCIYYYKANSGQPDSRNYGIKRSKGEFVSFCDDDDLWVLNKLEKQVAILNSNPDYGLVTGSIECINEDGSKTGVVKSHKGHIHGYVFPDFLIKNRTASIIPLVRKEVFKKVGYFNPDFTIGEDWEFWRRVSYYFKFYAIPEVLGYVRLHEDNMSKSRVNDPLVRFLLYRKLTTSLLNWGEHRFNKKDKQLIFKIEWKFYKKMFNNKCPGILKKLTLLKRIGQLSLRNAFHVIGLYLNNEVFSKV